jgi:carboxypeptidase D
VDQPAGTGFSLVSTDHFVHTEAEVRDLHELRRHLINVLTYVQASAQFMEFLKNFYQVFPEYKNVDVCRSLKKFSRRDSSSL